MSFNPEKVTLNGGYHLINSYVEFDPADNIEKDITFCPESKVQGDWDLQYAFVNIDGSEYDLPENIFNITETGRIPPNCTAKLSLVKSEYNDLTNIEKGQITNWFESNQPATFVIRWDSGVVGEQQVLPPPEVTP